MNYFKALCFIFGFLLILTRPLMHLAPKKWNEFELGKAYTEEKPKWLWIAGLASLIVISFTWYKHFTSEIPYSIIMAVFITLTSIKSSQLQIGRAHV